MLHFKQIDVTLESKNNNIMIKNVSFLFCMLTLITYNAIAQFKLPKTFVAFHGIYASPQDDNLSNNYHYGLGVDAEAGLGLGKTMITGSIGYLNFTAKNNTSGNLSFIPIEVGVRRYFLLGLFADAKVGVGVQSIPNDAQSVKLDNSSNFMYEIGAGFKVMGVEAVINFESAKNSNGNAANWSNNLLFKLGYCLKL